jgi:peptide/nickel transport system substrate-binding protein
LDSPSASPSSSADPTPPTARPARAFRWQILIALGGFVLLVALLVSQGPQAAMGEPVPVEGGAYSEALIGRISRLNPLLDDGNQVDQDVDRLLYRGLVSFDARGLPQPDLAEGWSVSADGTLYTLTLRDDAVWHDGEPVVSDDVIYTYSQFQDPDFPGPSDLIDMWQSINIIRLDDRTVQFQLPEPFAPFLDYLSEGLLPDHLLRGAQIEDLVDHPFNLEPVGTGPFRFERFLLEDGQIAGVGLAAFDDFYEGRPFLDRVEFRTFATEDEALEAHAEGVIQGLSKIDTDLLPRVLPDPELHQYTARLPESGVVFLNLAQPEKTFLADKQVRQALLLAINREWLINQALDGQGIVASGPILPGSWASSDDLEPTPFDPDQSAARLESAGWVLPTGATPGSTEYVRAKDGESLSLTLTHADAPLPERVASLIAENWRAVGVQTELQAVPAEDLLPEHLESGAYEALLTEIDYAPYPDPDPYPFWHDTQIENGQNYSGFDDRNSSIWLERARTTPDIGKRAEYYRSFEHRFRDQVPALFLYHPVYSYAVDRAVQGLSVGPLMDPSDRLAGIADWYLVARRAVAN